VRAALADDNLAAQPVHASCDRHPAARKLKPLRYPARSLLRAWRPGL